MSAIINQDSTTIKVERTKATKHAAWHENVYAASIGRQKCTPLDIRSLL